MSQTELLNQNGEGTGLTLGEGAKMQGLTREQIEARKARLAKIDEVSFDDAEEIAGTQYWEANDGDTITGEFLGFMPIEKNDAKSDNGKKELIVGGVATKHGIMLLGQMQAVEKLRQVEMGAIVQITCIKSKANEMKEFRVLKAKTQLAESE